MSIPKPSDERLLRLMRRLDGFSTGLGRAVAWLTLAMVLVMVSVVVLRYIFNIGNIALQESVMYLHGTVFMLGAAYTLAADDHVRVDIFYRKFSPRRQALVDLLGTLFLLLPFCILVLTLSWNYVMTSWHELEGSPDAGGLPFRYLLKTLLLILPLLLCTQGVAEIARAVLILRRPELAGTLRHHEEARV